MSTNASGSARILGTLRAAQGKGVVRLEDRFATPIDEVWSALTDPHRLAHWLGDVDGELHQGGRFRARYLASGWEGTCFVDVCEPSQRVVLTTQSPDEPNGVVEVTLAADGDLTTVVIEDRGLPLAQIAAYGAGDQIHIEDLAAYLAGRGRCDAQARWQELHPTYQQLAAHLT